MTHKKGILLINLGTPDDAQSAAVYRYLTEFLNDPYVIDLPAFIRWPLINGLIVPLRYKKSTAAYQKVWQTEGSPLLINHLALAKALQKELGDQYHVVAGMRYGKPSIKSAIKDLQQVSALTVIPLFPQYSYAATESALQAVLKEIKAQHFAKVNILSEFYGHEGYIASYTAVIQSALQNYAFDKLLFSYHGLPLRQVNKVCHSECDRTQICLPMQHNNAACYRAQCFHTSQQLAQALNLDTQQYCVSFQSRLGRTPWIKPYTDLLLDDLRQQGVEKLAVVCPSFVSDCLETLEEVNIRLRTQWLAKGGKDFISIPCLNDSPIWVKSLANMIALA